MNDSDNYNSLIKSGWKRNWTIRTSNLSGAF